MKHDHGMDCCWDCWAGRHTHPQQSYDFSCDIYECALGERTT